MRKPPAEVSEVLAALGHEVRLGIIGLLLHGERCVCEITPNFSRERTVVSRHLSVLEQAGIIRSRKDGRRVFYQIADSRVVGLLDIARRLVEQPQAARPVGPKSGVERCVAFESQRRAGR